MPKNPFIFMGTITKAIGFGVGALITTAAAGAVIKGINKFPRPMVYSKRKKKEVLKNSL